MVPAFNQPFGASLSVLYVKDHQMTKPSAFLTKDQVKSNIKTIATNAAAWLNLVQDTAIACMYHAREHGDVTLAQTLVLAIPATEKRTQQRVQLVSWFGAYSPIVVKNELDWPGKLNKSGKVAERGFRIDDATKNPWFLHGDKKSEDKQPLTLAALIERYRGMASFIDKQINEKKLDANDVMAARMFATHIRGVDLPDFKIEAYLEKERLEREANLKNTAGDGEIIDPVAKPAVEQEKTDENPAAPESEKQEAA